ncbi:MAG: hypothetical protein K2X03_02790 [Bryobacteraceae bacterium]|nr:hypothetical protein [Bryobacteraceae bacterium]
MIEQTFHLIGYCFGLMAFIAIYLMIRRPLQAAGREKHLQALLAIHFFRYFGLTALLPGVFNLAPAGFSSSYLTQIALGDVLAAFLALLAFLLLEVGSKAKFTAVWIFNIFGTLDYLNAGAQVTPSIRDANVLGPFGWIVMTVFLPAWLVSHLSIFLVLRQRPGS